MQLAACRALESLVGQGGGEVISRSPNISSLYRCITSPEGSESPVAPSPALRQAAQRLEQVGAPGCTSLLPCDVMWRAAALMCVGVPAVQHVWGNEWGPSGLSILAARARTAARRCKCCRPHLGMQAALEV